MKEFAPKISRYANASKGEYLAESFSAYAKGERDILDPEFVEFLDGRTHAKTRITGTSIQTGARNVDLAEWFSKKGKLAIHEYNKIRNENDISAIAKSSGMSEKNIEIIKNHLFFDKHVLYDGSEQRFLEDYDIAVAWYRLRDGKPKDRDILLLKHELAEAEAEKKYDLTASEAHEIAKQKFDWEQKIFEDLGEDGEDIDILQVKEKTKG